MFCPRCGRAVNETSNFCGGCGLSRAEIEKYIIKTEAPKAENAAPQPEEKAGPVTVSWESQPAEEAPKAQETVKAEEPSFAEKEFVAEAAKATEEAKEEEKKAEAAQQTYAESTYTAQQSHTQQTYTAQDSRQTYTAPANSENLSTVDFIWMMVISAIPVVGLIYLIVLAFSNDNTNKRSYARASLIMSIFAFVISFVFAIGFILSGL